MRHLDLGVAHARCPILLGCLEAGRRSVELVSGRVQYVQFFATSGPRDLLGERPMHFVGGGKKRHGVVGQPLAFSLNFLLDGITHPRHFVNLTVKVRQCIRIRQLPRDWRRLRTCPWRVAHRRSDQTAATRQIAYLISYWSAARGDCKVPPNSILRGYAMAATRNFLRLAKSSPISPVVRSVPGAGVTAVRAFTSTRRAAEQGDKGAWLFLTQSCSSRPTLSRRTSTRWTASRRCSSPCTSTAAGSFLVRALCGSDAALPRYIQQFSVYKDELTLYVAPSAVVPTMMFLRDHTLTQFKQLIDISGCDYPSRSQRFEVVYHLLSIRNNARLRVKTYADEVTPVPSVTGIYRSADWFEREAWDMFGIFFVGHPDLRRILTDYGFEGHPLRKDFPLTGYTEVRWDEERKRVVSEPVQLMQAHRNFESTSPWEQVGEGQSYTPNEYKLVPPKPKEDDKNKK